MTYTHAKFLHTLGASLALGSLMAGCAADAPPAPSGTSPAVTTTPTMTMTTGATVPPVGAVVPPSGPPAPPPAGSGTVPPPATTTAPTTTTPVATDTTTMPPVAPTGTDRPVPGMPTAPTTTPTVAPTTGGTTVPPDVLPTMNPTTDPPEDDEDPPAPMGEGNALTPTDELWIAATTNGVGVVGSWYEFHDAKSMDVAIAAVDGVVCLTGSVGAMADAEDYDTYGAGMGLNLNDEDEWDGSEFSGVSFTAEVTANNPVEVRFPIKGIGDGKEHYVVLKNGSNAIDWGDLEQKQWVIDEGSDEDFDAAAIISMQIAVVATVEDEGAFEVCISDLVVEE